MSGHRFPPKLPPPRTDHEPDRDDLIDASWDPPDRAMAKHDLEQTMYPPRTFWWKGFLLYDYVTNDTAYTPCEHDFACFGLSDRDAFCCTCGLRRPE